MELNTSNSTPAPLTGRELFPLSQGGAAFGALLAELGNLPRGAMLLRRVNYVADTSSTADADPGVGNLRWNHATQASATEIYIDDADSDAADHGSLWAGLAVGGHLYLYDSADPTLWQQWQVTAVTDAAGYLKLGVTLVGSNGSFADDAAIELSLQQPSPSPGVDRNVTTPLTSGATITIDWALGDFFVVTLGHNATIAFSNLPASGFGGSIRLRVTQDGTGSRTLAQPGSVELIDGSDAAIQSAAGAVTLIHYSTDGDGVVDATIKARGT